MPFLSPQDAKTLITRRHKDWSEFQALWRWLSDSLEGGDRYKHADYFRGPFEVTYSPWYSFGFDSMTGEGIPFLYGQIVKRNLIPKESEMSKDFVGMYIMRLSRTAVPRYVEFVLRRYLSRIYGGQIKRTGPKLLEEFWADVSSQRLDASKWWRKVGAPLLLTLGQLDIVLGHPDVDNAEKVETRADVKRLGLHKAVMDYILPENLVWWRKDSSDRYCEVLVHERCDDGTVHWRHWTETDSNVYTDRGEPVQEKSFEHAFGVCPVIRVFDGRNFRAKNVGQSRMEAIADLQKSIYNRRSELILSDVLLSHATLQGPEDLLQSTSSVKVGIGSILPMKRSDSGSSVMYQGWEFLDPPTTGAESTRQHIQDDLDEIMLYAALAKPAGMTTGKTVAQSGLSKSFDAREGNDLLSEIAETIEEAEEQAAKMALIVLTDGKASQEDLDSIEVEYPREYELFSATDLAEALADIQALISSAGSLPETEGELLKRLISVLLPGLDEERMGELHDEIDDAVARGAEKIDQQEEADSNSGADSTENPAVSLPNNASEMVQVAQSQSPPIMV